MIRAPVSVIDEFHSAFMFDTARSRGKHSGSNLLALPSCGVEGI